MISCDFSGVKRVSEERIQKGILPGVTQIITLNNTPVYEYTGGFCDVENKTPLTKDAIFRLASMTKPITVTACLILSDRGKLSVKDKVSKYFPEFSFPKVGKLVNGEVVYDKDALREMTVEDILTHSSGLGSGEVGDRQYSQLDISAYKSISERAASYGKWYLDFSPGEAQAYSPLVALDVVSGIVELVAGMPYEEFLQENIFEPLNMADTGYRLNEKQASRLVKMYDLTEKADGLIPRKMTSGGHDGFKMGDISGASGLFSTRDDYMNFACMLCGGGEYKGVRVLSERAVEYMRKPHFKFGFCGMDEYSDWGYAVRVRSAEKKFVQELTPESYGWSGAYNTHFWVDPIKKITGVYMSNMDKAGGAGAITAFEFECETMRAFHKVGL